MVSTLRLVALILSFALLVAPVSAEEIPNWPVPLLWGAPHAQMSAREGEAPAGLGREEQQALPTPPLPLIGITPCRIADTRDGTRPPGYGPPALSGGAPRNFPLTGQCGIAGTAAAVSLNITVTNTQGPGFISIYPQGGPAPLVSTLNYVAGQTLANAAVVPLGTGGGITVVAGVSGTDLIIDTNGYYGGGIVTTVNALSGDVNLAPGTNITITPAGQTLTIGGPTSLPPSGAAGGDLAGSYPNPSLKLPFSRTASSSNPLITLNNSGTGDGIYGSGSSTSGAGVVGYSASYIGVLGVSSNSTGVGVWADGRPSAAGLYGLSGSNYGVYGTSDSNFAVYGESVSGTAIKGYSHGGSGMYGVFGQSLGPNAIGVYGRNASTSGVTTAYIGTAGVWGDSGSGVGIYGTSFSNAAVAGACVPGHSPGCKAGIFVGDVDVQGTLTKASGSFKIDHPLDPENKYLYHSFVESPDMKNIYDGVVTLDESGAADVTLPDWFEALNEDFRYQLTAIGRPAPGLYIAEKLSGNQFKIAGGQPGAEVSWQVTGVRHDSYANAHRIRVEEEKTPAERESYLHPELDARQGTRASR